MLVSHRKKFIFIKTNKTASTSIESYFEKYCMPEGEWTLTHEHDEYVSETGIIGFRGIPNPDLPAPKWRNHMPASLIKELLPPDVWNDYYKFTPVRNPFDRLVSFFCFHHTESNFSDEELIRRFRGYCRMKNLKSPVKTYTIDGKSAVDGYIRFERIQEDMEKICKRLDIPFEPDSIPRFKVSTNRPQIPLHEFYDKRAEESVAEQFKFEIDLFGYSLRD